MKFRKCFDNASYSKKKNIKKLKKKIYEFFKYLKVVLKKLSNTLFL